MTGTSSRPAGPRLAGLALEALRRKDAHRAWLLADSLVRHAAGAHRVDALLLRAASFMQLGDVAAAESDIALAAHIDPLNPAVNASLLAHASPRQRSAAAKRLLLADDPAHREKGWRTLSEGFDCVGRPDLVDGHLIVALAWRGREPLTLQLNSIGGAAPTLALPLAGRDTGWGSGHAAEMLTIHPGEGEPQPGFDSVSTLSWPVPSGTTAVSFAAPGRRAQFEPSTILCPEAPKPTAADAATAGLLVIIPVYDDADATRSCLDALLRACPPSQTRRILVIDDVSPDPAIRNLLDPLAAEGRIELRRNAFNLGFAGSVNRALAERSPGWDALLLNADTLVPPGAIERLAAHLAAGDVGTVTPMSNNGEDTSIPQRFRVNAMPSPAEIERIDAMAQRAGAGVAVDMPNGVGFCLYIRGAVLDRIGPLSHEFGRGYYEDVEFCLRAAGAGYRNVCATDVYVGHHGGRSFGGEKRALVATNLRRLEQRFPSFRAQSKSFEAEDPLRPAAARLEAGLIATGPPFDLLLVPEAYPQSLSIFAATAFGRGTIIARVETRGTALGLMLRGLDGALPQSIRWNFSGSPDEITLKLAARLDKLPLRSIAFVAEDDLPVPLREAAAGLHCPTRSIPADREDLARRLAGAHRPGLRAPLPGERPILAVIMLAASPEDHAWVSTLAEEIAPSLAVVVAGSAPAGASGSLLYSGPIDDDELPDWLERLDARGILFASRRWGAADPRAALWAARGVPVECREQAWQAADAAARIAAWLDAPLPRQALGFPQGADEDAVQRLLPAG